MLLFCALDCVQWNRTVKSHKATLMLYRQRQQIQICKLAMTVDFAVVKRGYVQQAQVIWPKLMRCGLAQGLQGLNGYLERRWLLLTRLRLCACGTPERVLVIP